MNRFLWVTIALSSLVATAACGSTVNIEQERSALMAADREWSQTTKDPDRFVAFFADGASIYPTGMPIVTGGDAIRKTYTEMSKAPGFGLSRTPTKPKLPQAAHRLHDRRLRNEHGRGHRKGQIRHRVAEAA